MPRVLFLLSGLLAVAAICVQPAAAQDVVKDPEFVAEAEKAQLEISPVPGEKLQAIVKDLVATPPDIVENTSKPFRGKIDG